MHTNKKKQVWSRECTLVQHTVVRATAVSYGRPPILTTSKSETLEPIEKKFCTIDYVGNISGCTKNHNNQLHRDAPTHTRNTSFFVLPFLFYFCVLRLAHSPNGESHKGLWWPKRRAFRAGRAFWGPVDDVTLERSKPKNPQILTPQKNLQYLELR